MGMDLQSKSFAFLPVQLTHGTVLLVTLGPCNAGVRAHPCSMCPALARCFANDANVESYRYVGVHCRSIRPAHVSTVQWSPQGSWAAAVESSYIAGANAGQHTHSKTHTVRFWRLCTSRQVGCACMCLVGN